MFGTNSVGAFENYGFETCAMRLNISIGSHIKMKRAFYKAKTKWHTPISMARNRTANWKTKGGEYLNSCSNVAIFEPILRNCYWSKHADAGHYENCGFSRVISETLPVIFLQIATVKKNWKISMYRWTYRLQTHLEHFKM